MASVVSHPGRRLPELRGQLSGLSDRGEEFRLVFGIEFLKDASRLARQFVAILTERLFDDFLSEVFVLLKRLPANEATDTGSALPLATKASHTGEGVCALDVVIST